MEQEQHSKGDIKYHVARYLEAQQARLAGKKVLDLPAGNGVSSLLLSRLGAEPLPFDAFPEYFKVDGMNCQYSNVLDRIELPDHSVDVVLCQEGLEHFSDQNKVLNEFNRVLKPGGILLLTTPNYSGLRSRMSYFLTESEHFKKIMPPNEFDSVWMNAPGNGKTVYFGHLFLIGACRLRTLGKLSGFKLLHQHPTESNTTSWVFLPLFYPFIYLRSALLYLKNKAKAKGNPEQIRTYRELFQLSTNLNTLVNGHLFFEFEKECEVSEVLDGLKGVHREFGRT